MEADGQHPPCPSNRDCLDKWTPSDSSRGVGLLQEQVRIKRGTVQRFTNPGKVQLGSGGYRVTNQDDKYLAEANACEKIPNFAARPLSGAGRWALLHNNETVLFTNDSNILYAEGDGDEAYWLRIEIDSAYDAGQTATQAFDQLRAGATVITGDLSELA